MIGGSFCDKGRSGLVSSLAVFPLVLSIFNNAYHEKLQGHLEQ